MKLLTILCLSCAFLAVATTASASSTYPATISLFKGAGASEAFFAKSYAYAVFPTVGEGALGIGGGHGRGHVYIHNRWVGDVTMSELSIGFQAGGKAFSQIIFFEDKRALDEFRTGSFQFGADAGVVAVTAGASASSSTTGNATGASAGMHDAVTHGQFYKGMAVFTIAKGGLMGQVSIEGEKFTYSAREAS